MDTITTNKKLREALHSIYVAQFEAIKKNPDQFDGNDATRMLTGLMGSRPWSWRVIGITPAALEIYAKNDFKSHDRQVQRGHMCHRRSTAEELYYNSRTEPMSETEFFEFFLPRDETVLMAKSENPHKPGKEFPKFISINKQLGLFPCGSLMGWKYHKKEMEYLRELHAKQ